MKVVEYFYRLMFKSTSLEDTTSMLHFGLTSEDVTNIAYALMLKKGVNEVMLPALYGIRERLEKFAMNNKGLAALALTHGQPASPTTFGKKFAVFYSRLDRGIKELENFTILAKLNGASGNYDAHQLAYPNVDWIKFSEKFIKDLDFYSGAVQKGVRIGVNLITTQIEPHDSYASLFDTFKRINTILIGFDQDMWRYISDGSIKQEVVKGQVSSSAMPHKAMNPIDFEQSEGKLGEANALLKFFSEKLPISRLERDLSDFTVQRDIGLALGFSLIGYKGIMTGLDKIKVDGEAVALALANVPAVITEGIAAGLRREGVADAYEQLKDLARGKKVTLDDVRIFVEGLELQNEELRRRAYGADSCYLHRSGGESLRRSA